jgi:hypothetical protein|tara:strand:- start:709 stop:1428 length:720 start_codon:yes stop_codon:yes gene_type:complete
MKKIFFTFLISTSLIIFADNHDEPNYSKFQANYFFNCPNEPACGAAFDKLMKSSEVAKENFEASLLRVSHAGSSDITHSIQFYYKSAERYQRAGEVFSNSKAFAEFGQSMAAAGAQPVYNNLTSYLIAEGDGRKSTAGVTFVANVSNPAVYAPAFAKMAKKMFKEPFGGNSYVLRVEHLGNGSSTHSVSVSFDDAAAALEFLANYPNTSQFSEFVQEAGTSFESGLSYMTINLMDYNPD